MSAELKRQVVEYGKQMLEAAPPITEAELDAVLDHEIDPHAVRPRTRRLGPWVAVSAAAVTLVLFGLVALFVSGDGPLVDADSFSWSRVPHDEAVFGDKVPFTGGIGDVTVGGPGLVAVGEGDDGIAVWTSVEGFTWSPVPHDEEVFGGTNRMWSVTSGGPGLVAVGGDGGDAAVWTSVDGLTWSRVPHDEEVFGGAGMGAITAGGPGLVAVGDSDSGAVVWTSVDGITWSRVPHDEEVFGGDGEQSMSSVTAGGPGLVAVGSDGFDDGVDRGEMAMWRRDFLGSAAVWVSVDGLAWSRVTHDEAVFGGDGNQWMDDVTSTSAGLVAVGGDWSSEARASSVWTSVDGIAWFQVPYDEAVFGGENDQAMNSVTAVGSGVVAVGRAWGQSGGDHSEGSDDSAASVWTSEDGITWTWLGYDEAVFGSEDNSGYLLTEGPVFTEYRQLMTSVTVTDSGIVAVGADWSGPSHGAAVWIGVPED